MAVDLKLVATRYAVCGENKIRMAQHLMIEIKKDTKRITTLFSFTYNMLKCALIATDFQLKLQLCYMISNKKRSNFTSVEDKMFLASS